MYEMENQVTFTKCGKNGKLKLHEAASLMMDSCQFQEYQEAEFCRFLRENQLAIFLFSIQIDILRMPEFREKVRTAVKIYGCKSIYGLRRITLRDEAGKICLISNATGAFFDLRAGKAAKLDPETLPLKFDDPEPMECLPRKIPVSMAEAEKLRPFPVTGSNLDPNGHLTSPVYFALAEDALPENYAYSRIRIEFRKQAKPGEMICPVRFTEPERCVIDLADETGAPCAVAEFSHPQF